MSEVLLIATLASILADSAPIIFASLGETLNERAGVVNLSVEGTMMLSAMVAFATAFVLDGYGPMVYFGADLAPYITVGAGFAAAMVAGALIALVNLPQFNIHLAFKAPCPFQFLEGARLITRVLCRARSPSIYFEAPFTPASNCSVYQTSLSDATAPSFTNSVPS